MIDPARQPMYDTLVRYLELSDYLDGQGIPQAEQRRKEPAVTYRILSWDWREQMDREQLARAVAEVSGGGIFVREVETGDAQYTIIVSDVPLTPKQAVEAYEADLRSDGA